MTEDQIEQALVSDTRPRGPDGCSNVDRILFVAKVFGLQEIDLTLDFDFSSVTTVDDPVKVAAAKHLALLKLDLINRRYDSLMLTKLEYDREAAPLILAVQRMDHHLSFLEDGLPTPPFSAFR